MRHAFAFLECMKRREELQLVLEGLPPADTYDPVGKRTESEEQIPQIVENTEKRNEQRSIGKR
jgi:hypothetical protein